MAREGTTPGGGTALVRATGERRTWDGAMTFGDSGCESVIARRGDAVMPERGRCRREELVRQWVAELGALDRALPAGSSVESRVRDLVDLVATALEGPSGIDGVGRTVGGRLAAMRVPGDEVLTRSLELLRRNLVSGAENEVSSRIPTLLTAITAGYVGADHENTVTQQEAVKRALLRSKLRAERDLWASEARFRRVFTTSPAGMAISDLHGGFVEVNPALVDMLGYSEQELCGMTVHELFLPDAAEELTAAYTAVAEGSRQCLRERCDLIRADGERAWAYLVVSLLRDADDAPSRIVTMVEDLRELSSLQTYVHDQSLYDGMTGLANRECFRSRVERTLARSPAGAVITLYQLGLEAFEHINNGLGREVGDTVLREVAHRLEGLIQGEAGVVARISGTEFAILLEQGDRTPGVASFATRINEELAEPIYVGDGGVATSVGIGVVQRTAAEADPDDMIRGADVALRRAEATGRRQWALFDPDRAPYEREEAKLVAVMPGALELGEFEVVYQPLVSLDGGRTSAVEVQVRWRPDGHEQLDHEQCLRLAERSGVTLSLRDWMLRTAWEQLAEWHRAGHRPWLVAELGPNQVRDPDLVGRLREILDGGTLDQHWLRVGVPMTALMDESEEARDNVDTLSEMAVRTTLHGFRGSPEELRMLLNLSACEVRLAPELVRMVHESDSENSPEVRAVTGTVPLVRDCGVPIAVSDLDSAEQADRWRSMGCETGAGAFYGAPMPAEEMTRLLGRG
ncbi:putative bifunctional diguanylate cyclase/phosphodiesterase [Halosaccharopolyspora lacisalsi]|nr:EAL domain-containing protein [Halosaccharopolyspora lacisalsi]